MVALEDVRVSTPLPVLADLRRSVVPRITCGGNAGGGSSGAAVGSAGACPSAGGAAECGRGGAAAGEAGDLPEEACG
jgi:hypothetical protein